MTHLRHSRAGRPLHNRQRRACPREDGGRESRGGRGGWVPVSTGTTGPAHPPPSFARRETLAQPSFGRRACPREDGGRESRGGRGDGFPSPRERRGQRTHLRHSRAGRPLHNRHRRGAQSLPSTVAQPSFPRRACPRVGRGRESRGGRGDGFPSPRERRGQRTHLDAGGSYAKVSERGNLCPAWCVIATPKAGRNVGRPNQVGESRELTLPQPVHPE